MRLLNKKGFISYKTLIFLAFVCAIGFGVYKIGPPIFANEMFKSGLEDEIKTAHMFTDEVLTGRIIDLGRTWGLDLDKDSIQINRGDRDINVTVKYHVTVNFFSGYTWDHDFNVYKAGRLAITGPRV
jgi:hypothetical protein